MNANQIPERSLTREELNPEIERPVRVAGEPVGHWLEPNQNPDRVDHLFVAVRAGPIGLVEIALNTFSIRNLRRGFDPRIRLAVVSSPWSVLPPPGIFTSPGFDYDVIESTNAVTYREYERAELEDLFIEKIKRAIFVEGWGDLYLRAQPGIHQVHSRRKNTIVPVEALQRDGAIKFYFAGTSELLLMKYFGQK